MSNADSPARWLARDLLAHGASLVESHFAWTLIGLDDVWKVKKPVALGDLDCTDLRRRREACADEVRENQALAPGVYRGFVPITVDSRGRRRLGGPGRAVEWAVHMRRLSATTAAHVRLAGGRLRPRDLRCVADRIARFHARLEPARDPQGLGSPAQLTENLEQMLSWIRDGVGEMIDRSECQRLEHRLRSLLDQQGHRLAARLAAGRVHDLHGDLRLDHIYLHQDTVTIIDRLELGQQFRHGDVAADVASLAVDLENRGQKSLAAGFVADYAEHAEDPAVVQLVDFYAAYVACRRSCLLALLARDVGADAQVRANASRQARNLALVVLATDDARSLRHSVGQPFH